jgi:hypothetical protein
MIVVDPVATCMVAHYLRLSCACNAADSVPALRHVRLSASDQVVAETNHHIPVNERALALFWAEETSESGSDGGPGKMSLKSGSTTSSKVVTVVVVG